MSEHQSSGLAICGRADHHKGLVNANVWHEENEEGHQYEPSWSQPLEDASDRWVQDKPLEHQLPPSSGHYGLTPRELGRLLFGHFGPSHPQVGARVQNIEGNEGDNEHSRHDTGVLAPLDDVVNPSTHRAKDQQQRPIFHKIGRHHTTISTDPEADVFTVELVPDVVLRSLDDGVQEQRGGHVEQLC